MITLSWWQMIMVSLIQRWQDWNRLLVERVVDLTHEQIKNHPQLMLWLDNQFILRQTWDIKKLNRNFMKFFLSSKRLMTWYKEEIWNTKIFYLLWWFKNLNWMKRLLEIKVSMECIELVKFKISKQTHQLIWLWQQIIQNKMK